MRISDGSSDVCSSDLGVGRHRALALRRDVTDALSQPRQAFERALAHLGCQRALAVESLGQAHGFAHAIDGAQLPQGVARDDHVEAVRTQVDRGEHVAVLQGSRGGRDEGRDLHAQIFASSAACARSEENTSELKSLMRISYAVYCLKKKTKL